MKRALLLVALATIPLRAAASSFGASQAGTSGAPFLMLGADARAAGMGNAVSAFADDASGTYWNPADLAGLRERHATFTHAASYQSTFYDFLAYAQPLRGPAVGGRDFGPNQLGAVGVTFQYQNSGRLAEIDNTGAATGQTFTPQDLAASIGWGAELLRGLDVGLAFKYVSSKIEASAETGAVDAGVRWRTQLPGTEAGYAVSAAVRNAGGQLRFRDASDPLPLTVVIGQAVHPFRSLAIDLDLNAPRDAAPYASLGAEWRAPLTEGLTGALRAGYDGRVRSGDVGGMAGITVGGGIGFQRLAFDYAWAPAGELGDVQRVSLSFRF